MSVIFWIIRDLENRDIGDIVTGDSLPPRVRIDEGHPEQWIAQWLNARINHRKAIVGHDGYRRVMTSDFASASAQQCTLWSKIESLSQGRLTVVRPKDTG